MQREPQFAPCYGPRAKLSRMSKAKCTAGSPANKHLLDMVSLGTVYAKAGSGRYIDSVTCYVPVGRRHFQKCPVTVASFSLSSCSRSESAVPSRGSYRSSAWNCGPPRPPAGGGSSALVRWEGRTSKCRSSCGRVRLCERRLTCVAASMRPWLSTG